MTADAGGVGAPRFDVVLRGYDRRQVDEHVARLQRVMSRMRADLELVRSQPIPVVQGPQPGQARPVQPSPGAPRPTPRPRPDQPDMIGSFTDRMQSILQAAEEEAAEIRGRARAETESVRAEVADLIRQRDAVVHELTRLRGQLEGLLNGPTSRMAAAPRDGANQRQPAPPAVGTKPGPGDGRSAEPATTRKPRPGPAGPRPPQVQRPPAAQPGGARQQGGAQQSAAPPGRSPQTAGPAVPAPVASSSLSGPSAPDGPPSGAAPSGPAQSRPAQPSPAQPSPAQQGPGPPPASRPSVQPGTLRPAGSPQPDQPSSGSKASTGQSGSAQNGSTQNGSTQNGSGQGAGNQAKAAHRLPTGAYPAAKGSSMRPDTPPAPGPGDLFRPADRQDRDSPAVKDPGESGDIEATTKVSPVRPTPRSDATVSAPAVKPADAPNTGTKAKGEPKAKGDAEGAGPAGRSTSRSG